MTENKEQGEEGLSGLSFFRSGHFSRTFPSRISSVCACFVFQTREIISLKTLDFPDFGTHCRWLCPF